MAEVKICGVRDRAVFRAALMAGARYIGLVFYPPSPRALTIEEAGALAKLRREGTGVEIAALFVGADDRLIAEICRQVQPDLMQLHGNETPERVREVRERFDRPVSKAIGVTDAQDLEQGLALYRGCADWLLFDAKPPQGATRPGGNATSFDWSLLGACRPAGRWMLSGGLHQGNVADAIAKTGARTVDVSSGVETRPGIKDPQRIRDFVACARAAGP